MDCSLLGLTPHQIGVLREFPKLTIPVLDVRSEAALRLLLDRIPPARANQRAVFEAQLKVAQTRIADAKAYLDEFGALEEGFELDKVWDAMHYALTGRVDSRGEVADTLAGGQELGDDVGYGPARLQDAPAIRAFAEYLAGRKLAELQQRMNIAEMRRLDVYPVPSGPDTDSAYESEIRSWIADFFEPLRSFIGRMAGKGNGLLIWLS